MGTAVKSTCCPEQITVVLAEIFTSAGAIGFTVIATAFEVAGEPVAQAKFDVIIQVITSPLFKVVVLKFGLFVPELLPFTCH